MHLTLTLLLCAAPPTGASAVVDYGKIDTNVKAQIDARREAREAEIRYKRLVAGYRRAARRRAGVTMNNYARQQAAVANIRYQASIAGARQATISEVARRSYYGIPIPRSGCSARRSSLYSR